MASRTIKEEKDADNNASTSASAKSLSLAEIELRLITLGQEEPRGITSKTLEKDMPGLDSRSLATVINKMVSQNRLELLKQNNELLYKLKDPSALSKVKGADAEEKVVFGIIEEAGNKGIWIRDIRFKSNLTMTQLNKVLKSLEGKKLIKAVTSVAAAKKKVYMLYNLEPDRSVTGGAWYSDQDFESEFVDILNQQCYRFLQTKIEASRKMEGGPLTTRGASFASLEDVTAFIAELGISKVKLKPEDIEVILDTLIYDGKVEKSVIAKGGSGQVKLFRAVESILPPTGLVTVPCGICPVASRCSDIGAVTPQTCLYLKEWID